MRPEAPSAGRHRHIPTPPRTGTRTRASAARTRVHPRQARPGCRPGGRSSPGQDRRWMARGRLGAPGGVGATTGHVHHTQGTTGPTIPPRRHIGDMPMSTRWRGARRDGGASCGTVNAASATAGRGLGLYMPGTEAHDSGNPPLRAFVESIPQNGGASRALGSAPSSSSSARRPSRRSTSSREIPRAFPRAWHLDSWSDGDVTRPPSSEPHRRPDRAPGGQPPPSRRERASPRTGPRRTSTARRWARRCARHRQGG